MTRGYGDCRKLKSLYKLCFWRNCDGCMSCLSIKDNIHERGLWIMLTFLKIYPNQKLETRRSKQRPPRNIRARRYSTTRRTVFQNLSRLRNTFRKWSDGMNAVPWNLQINNHNVIKLCNRVANHVCAHNWPPNVEVWPIHRPQYAQI